MIPDLSDYQRSYHQLEAFIDGLKARDSKYQAISHRINYMDCIDIHGFTLLHYAVLMGDFSLVKKCVEAGATVKDKPKLLGDALKNNSLPIAEYLFERGVCDLNALLTYFLIFCQDLKSLAWALSQFEKSSELRLLERYLSLTIAAQNGDFIECKSLLEQGISPNPTKKMDGSPLYFAILNNLQDIFDLLLEHNVDINQQTLKKTSSLMIATGQKNPYFLMG